MINCVEICIKQNRIMQHDFKLIDTTYKVEDAKDVLLSLIDDKIKFLGMQVFSLSERFGTDTIHLEKRMVALKKERENLIKIFAEQNNPENKVEIDCSVKLKIGTKEIVL